MTIPWTIPADLWTGETVAILGAGPDMTAELAETARGHTLLGGAHRALTRGQRRSGQRVHALVVLLLDTGVLVNIFQTEINNVSITA